jgi:acetolactate synthase I/II/III large subunit
MTPRTGGRILVDQLALHGVGHVFCVPGESYLAVLDALHDSAIALTVCRQEGGAAMMAEAHGKLTGQPGICMVTRGPGAMNAAPGIHIARHDSTPMILFVGQVERGVRDREAFQELNYRAVFGSVAKWVTEIDDPARIPELVARAFHVATSGRPGPVVIALPEDMLTQPVAVADAPRYRRIGTSPAPEAVAQFQQALTAARRPVAILGGSRWSAASVAAFADFADRFALPVLCSFRRQMLFPADHACFAGDLGLGVNPKVLARVKDADLVVLLGCRLSEIPSQGYTLLDQTGSAQTVVHVHADASELGSLYAAQIPIHAAPDDFVQALVELAPAPEARPSRNRIEEAHRDYLAWSDPSTVTVPGPLQMGQVMLALQAALPADAILCNGAGNFATWIHRFWPFRHFGTQLATTAGSMGYGVPAAVGAKRLRPDATVVVIAGDGDFLMNGQEFATAIQYGLAILVIVIDNGMYGTIRMHQEREYPGRMVGTGLKNPDFAGYARVFGGHGERVECTEEFAPALRRALDSGQPAILHCLLDPEAINPTTTLSLIRQRSLAASGA